MDKRFLHKVVGQLIRETEIDRYKKKVYFPFDPYLHFSSFMFSSLLHFSSPTPSSFYKHCRDIYGLNEEEIKYVWNEYKNSITFLIKNG